MFKKIFISSVLLVIFVASNVLAGSVDKLKDKALKHRDYKKAIEEIVEQGDAAVDDLVSLVLNIPNVPESDDLWNSKVTAMDILGEMKSQRALTQLGKIFTETENISAIYNSARAIGNTGGSKAYQILSKTIINPGNIQRKRAAILGLGLCGDSKAIPLLKNELHNINNDELTRIYSAGSLGILGVTEGYDVALAALNAANGENYSSAIQSLGLVGNPACLDDLKRINQLNSAPIPRRFARVAIAMIESKQLLDDAKVTYIRDALYSNAHTTEMVRWGASQLKKLNSLKSREVLKNMSEDTNQANELLRHIAFVKVKTMR